MIVPALNEEAAIAAAVASAADADEVIVVDGGSTDRTREIARQSGARILEAARGRGLQQNEGAAVARGEVLLFLHADTLLPAGFREQVLDSLSDGRAGWGRFDLRFDAGGPLLRLIARLISLRSRISRVATGDQAIFVRRALFERLGGFTRTSSSRTSICAVGSSGLRRWRCPPVVSSPRPDAGGPRAPGARAS